MAATKPSAEGRTSDAQVLSGIFEMLSGALFCSQPLLKKEEESSVAQIGSLILGGGLIVDGARRLTSPLRKGAIECWQEGKKRVLEATDGARKWFLSSEKSARIGKIVLGGVAGAAAGYSLGIALIPSLFFGSLTLSNLDLGQEKSTPIMQVLIGLLNRPFAVQNKRFTSLSDAIAQVLQNPKTTEEQKAKDLELFFYEALRIELQARPHDFPKYLTSQPSESLNALERIFLTALDQIAKDIQKQNPHLSRNFRRSSGHDSVD